MKPSLVFSRTVLRSLDNQLAGLEVALDAGVVDTDGHHHHQAKDCQDYS